MSCGCCLAWAAGRLPGRLFFFCCCPFLSSSLYCGCCPARAAGRLPGAGHGVRGENSPLHPRTPLLRECGGSLLNGAVPCPPRVAWGVGADLPGRSVRVMSAPAAALRPPFGRTGSPSRPRHRCICGGAEGLALPEVRRNGKIDGRGCAGRRQKGKIQREWGCRTAAKGELQRKGRGRGGRSCVSGGSGKSASRGEMQAGRRACLCRKSAQRGMTGGVGDGKRGVAFHLCKSESVQEYFFGGRLPQEKRWCSRNAYFPEKSALGEGWGAWGKGNTPCAPAKGVSFPPETTPAPVRFRRRRGVAGRDCGADFFRYRRGGGGGCRG